MVTNRQKQKEASSKKMLEAACEQFALKGYSGTKIADIAGAADVAVGLVSQRFGTKDGLYKEALAYICGDLEGILNDDDLTCILLGIINKIKTGGQNQSRAFRFFVNHVTDPFVPADCEEVSRRIFNDSKLKPLLDEAILEGTVVNGDSYDVFMMFVKTSLFITDSFVKSGITLSSDAEYMRLLRATNDKQLAENQAIISALSGDFDYVGYVDAEANSVINFRVSDELREIMGTIDAHMPSNKRLDAFFKKLIVPQDFSKFLKDVNRERLVEELSRKPAVHIEFSAQVKGAVQHFVLKFAKDINNPKGYILGLSNREAEYAAYAHEERKNEVMRLLSQEYTGIYYVDLLTGKFELFSMRDRLKNDIVEMLKGASDAVEAFGRYVEATVHPADRQRMMSTMRSVRERLEHTKSFTEVFRRNYDGEYLFTEMNVVKIDEADDPATAIVLGFAERDSELKMGEKQEEAMRNGIRILYQTEDARTALNSLMKILVDYHESDCAYIFELNRDRTLIRMSYEAVCDGLVPIVDDEKYEPVETRQFWFDTFAEKGELVIKDTKTEIPKDNPVYAKCLHEEVDNFMCVPLVSDGEITGFIGVDNAGFANGDLMILRTIAALVACEILRRQQSGEEHTILDKIASNFNSVYYVDFDSNYIRNYTISDEYRSRYESVKYYDKYIDACIENDVTEDDAEKFRRMTSPAYVREQFRTKDSFAVNFIDDSAGAGKNYELLFIKANPEGTRAVLCSKDNSEAVEHEKAIRRTQQEQMELLISERTAELQEKNKQLSRINEDVIELLGNITEARDSDSGEHIRRVKGFTNILATQVMKDLPEYGLTDRIIGLMTSASALHDVGKIMIPDAVLLKPGRLTKEEFEVMKSHCIRGVEILENAPSDWSAEYLKMGMDIARHHHEKYDGSGYPDGLAGDDIPISAQIVSVADCFDALTTKRVYKDAFSCEKAFDMIMTGECGVFSEKLLACFEKCRDAFFDHAVNVSSPYADAIASPADKPSLSGTKILFAEDNEVSRNVCTELLESEGAIVTAVGDGRDAVELFRRTAPGVFDAILMDVMMPGMNGIEATLAIRCMDSPHAKSIPIIALTSSNSIDDMEKCMRVGMNSYLTKPFSISAVTRVLLECLRDQSDALLEQLTMAVKMSNRDPLTGVKNMTAYTDMIGVLTEEIRRDSNNVKFGLVECDINGLKLVNDQYGHDIGDTYIKNCCSLICSIFKHSPVFRIGGDEFVIILRGDDYDTRASLMDELRRKISDCEKITSVFDGRASLAYGLAVFDTELDDGVSTVFRRADGSMYNKKRLMKFSSGVRQG